MKIYLAGPMSGYPDLNFPAFMAAAEHLRTLGHEVVNPAELNPDPSAKWHDCMKVDIRELLTCEAIATLPGFEKSKGASLEFHIAAELEFTHIPMTGETLKGETNYYVSGTVSKLVAAVIAILMFCVIALAQTFPRWPANQTVHIYTLAGSFSPAEQGRIKAVVEAWRPLLPAGMTMTIAGEASHVEECQGCVTLNRETVIKSRWAECESHTNDKGLTKYAIIRIDPRAGSGDKFQRRVEHEFGHLLGLDHRPDSIMTARPHGKPSEKDAAILRGIYAAPTVAKTERVISVESQGLTWSTDPNIAALDTILAPHLEAEMVTALQRYTFRRVVSIQTLDDAGNITGDYERISRLILTDNGERVERMLSRHSRLKGMRITAQDETDFSGAQIGIIDCFADYRFARLRPGVLSADPLLLYNGHRVFKGEIQVDSQGRIVELRGTTLPEGSERFPVFTATRTLVEGHLFPSEMTSEGVLQFGSGAVRYRWRVNASDYRRFGSRVSLKEVE